VSNKPASQSARTLVRIGITTAVLSAGYGLTLLRPQTPPAGQTVTTIRNYWLDAEKTACADTGANVQVDNDTDPSDDKVGQIYPEGHFSNPNRTTLPSRCAYDPNDPREERAEPVAVVVPPAQAIPSTVPSYNPGTVICSGRQYNYGTRCPEPLGAIWAAGTQPTAVQIRGAGATILGTIHSEGGVAVSGSGNTVSRVESVTQPTILGAGNNISSSQLAVLGGQTFQQSFNHDLSFRKIAIEVAPLTCPSTGPLTINASTLIDNRAYNPGCSLIITGAGVRKKVTIGSQYSVTIAGAGLTFDPAVPGYAAVFGENVTITGANVRVNGSVQAYFDIKVAGAGAILCGLVGDTVDISGAGTKVQSCL
jgi:hypothetical protein